MQKVNKRYRTVILFEAFYRDILWKYFSGLIPLYLVTEYPKSGGSWFCQMLSDYLEVPFPRNERPVLSESVLHGHMLYDKRYKNVTVIVRDGRDIMVSAYYHYLFENDRNINQPISKMRHILNFENNDDIKNNMPAFIEFMFTQKVHKFNNFTWKEFIDSWLGKNVTIIKYEDLLVQSEIELINVIQNNLNQKINLPKLKQSIYKYSFKNQTKREAGIESRTSFIRKGIAGDWRNVFSPKACEIFNKYAGESLIKLGYETDDTWINGNYIIEGSIK